MVYVIIILVIGIATSLFFMHKPFIRFVAEKKAIPEIEKILFRKNDLNKSNILDVIHELTSCRLNDELVMDYFYKIKGIQVLNNQPINFWLKIYLTTPTKVKLNYFEQVKFYETFLNFPKAKNSEKTYKTNKTISHNNFRSHAKTRLAKSIISHKLA